MRKRLLPLFAGLARSLALSAVLTLSAGLALSRAAATARTLPGTPVPARFVGVNLAGPLFGPGVDLNGQFDRMVASGVGTVRGVFSWEEAQPYANESQVPVAQRSQFVDVGGIPTNFSATDQLVSLAAKRGLTVLPTVIYAPAWDMGQNPFGGLQPPATDGPYANYVTALVHRYGPHGSFWRTHRPRLPIRAWQIWNEPNLTAYWPQPFASSYVALLRAAHAAIKRADPGAEVVMAAMTNATWIALGDVYAIHGARKLFDAVAVNGFTTTPDKVIQFLHLTRRAMNRGGDHRKPLLYTEMSWPTSVGQGLERFDWDTTDAGQARKIAAVLPKLAAHRRALGLSAFYYYTWLDAGAPGDFDDFDFAGLSTLEPNGTIVAKPGLAEFKRAALRIEGCRRKGRTATRCVK